MNKIVSFDDFKNKSSNLTEETGVVETHEDGHQYYMFFQNLASIKHYIDEIMQMNPEEIDSLLRSGHDWAADHIATSKDDIQEVAEWIRNEMESGEGEEEETDVEMIEPDNISVEIEDDEEEEKNDEEE